jgi:hypothetical protein
MKLSFLSARLGIQADISINILTGLDLLTTLSFYRSYCVQVLKKTFVFTGGEIVNEFLMSTGYLPGAHDESCPIYKKVASLRPAWMRGSAKDSLYP